MSEAPSSIRLDKWLWYARFFKTRTLAAKQVTGGHVRVNAQKVSKASHTLVVGDVLTFPQARRIRVIEVVALGTRRGPAPEAQALYEDRTPPPAEAPPQPSVTRFGTRPTKKQRRDMERAQKQAE